jgi:hypothetical protein
MVGRGALRWQRDQLAQSTAFGVIGLFSLIAAVIASLVTAENQEIHSSLLRPSVRLILFAGWWTLVTSLTYVSFMLKKKILKLINHSIACLHVSS